MSYRCWLIPAAALFLATNAYAQSGAEIGSRGVPGVTPCANCHGQRGEGDASGGGPRLAGQSSYYLEKQLRAYIDGLRRHPVMVQIAKTLTEEQREIVSIYYATLDAPSLEQKVAISKAAAARGRVLARVGDRRLGVQACRNCHGPGGIGEPPAYPYVAGQVHQYLLTTLQDWQRGARLTDPTQHMKLISRALSAGDLRAVSGYYARLSPPKPHTTTEEELAQRGRGAAGTAPATQPGVGTEPAQGLGTEGGAPTMGGSQGPGGAGGASGSGADGSRSGRP